MKRIVLVGGGHAHLHVLLTLATRPMPGVETILISGQRRQLYSGMVPGYLQGRYGEYDVGVDLLPLCRRAGVTFREAWAERVDGASQVVVVGGDHIAFDRLSLDVGAASAGQEVPGVAAHALAVRPMHRVLALEKRLKELAATRAPSGIPVVVVGGGAAGVEVALAIQRRFADGPRAPRLVLCEAGPEILPGYGHAVRRAAVAILEQRGIGVRLNSPVEAVIADAVFLPGGEAIPAALTVWLAGAAPPPLLAASDLPLDPGGFFQVDRTLRAVNGLPVWGAGDCIGLLGHPTLPKAGVFAVRAAPILANNLLAMADGGAPREYLPQAHFLSLLDTADGRALLCWRGLALHTAWALHLKHHIDITFLHRYQKS